VSLLLGEQDLAGLVAEVAAGSGVQDHAHPRMLSAAVVDPTGDTNDE
jgi:hypothetical protein